MRGVCTPQKERPCALQHVYLCREPSVARWRLARSKLEFLSGDELVTEIQISLLSLFPHPLWLSPEADCLAPSKTTRSPISFIAKLRRPRPSPSPKGKPESSKSALNDSICGATNSFNIGNAELPVGVFLKVDSRANVLKVCLELSSADILILGRKG